MVEFLYLLAQRPGQSEFDVWLDENPLVLGLGALALGGLVALSGVYTLRTGVTRNKLGMEFRGGTANVAGIVRVVVGVAICLFGLYKLFAG